MDSVIFQENLNYYTDRVEEYLSIMDEVQENLKVLQDSVSARQESMDKEEKIFEDVLSGMYATFVLAKQRLQNTPPNPTMDHLWTLIKSKGTLPPPVRKKQALQKRVG